MLLMFISTKVYLENPPILLLISKPDFEEVYTEKKNYLRYCITHLQRTLKLVCQKANTSYKFEILRSPDANHQLCLIL